MKLFEKVVTLAIEAGGLAVKQQSKISSEDRESKIDGSVVTRVDRDVEDFLCTELAKVTSDANFITEERAREFKHGAELTFVIDPIDGTDAYSSNQPFWSVSVGLCDVNLKPIAGIVYAPRLGLLFAADSENCVMLNHQLLPMAPQTTQITPLSTVFINAYSHQFFNFKNFPGKIRCVNTASQLCFVAAFPTTVAALTHHTDCIWDVAAAHAILSACGCSFSFINGEEIDYRKFKEKGWQLGDFALAIKPGAKELLAKIAAFKQLSVESA